MKRLLSIGIILLFIGMSISSSTGFNAIEQSKTATSNSNTLYVGGSGPNNYTKIQDAIDDASDGDTVFVYNDSSPYNEHIIVDKSITLIGEDKNTTTIKGNDRILALQAENITISRFKIQRHSFGGIGIHIGGIGHAVITQNIITNYDCIYGKNAHDISITENIFQNNYARHGIWLENCNSITVSDNFFNSYHTIGFRLDHCEDIHIFENEIKNNHCGIYEDGTSSNIQIFNNYLANNDYGMNLYSSNLNIHNNIIQKNKYGLVFAGDKSLIYNNELRDNKLGFRFGGRNNKVYENNFINNSMEIEYYLNDFILFLLFLKKLNKVDGNYWENHPLIIPKRIEGILFWYTGYPPWEETDSIPWRAYDRHPAKEPYDIEV